MTTSWRLPAAERDPGRAAHPAQVLLVGVIAAVGVFEALWFGVVTRSGLALVDPVVIAWVVAHRGAGLTTAARVVTDVGSPAVVLTVTILVLGWWAWRRDGRRALTGLGGTAGLVVVDLTAKVLVARPRPPLPFHAVAAQGYAFPSGHAMLSAGAVLMLLWLWRPLLAAITATARTVVLTGAVVAVLAVGCSRIVLGVHYPGDVLAGWALAVLVVAAMGLIDVLRPRSGS